MAFLLQFDRCQVGHHRLLLLALCYIMMAVLSGLITGADAWAQAGNPEPNRDTMALRSELDNIRALAFGFRAICEDADLKLRSPHSATFVIRDSRLCRARSRQLLPAQQLQFILCSNDPADRIDQAPEPIPQCAELPQQWYKWFTPGSVI